jgi:hypothetical protein
MEDKIEFGEGESMADILRRDTGIQPTQEQVDKFYSQPKTMNKYYTPPKDEQFAELKEKAIEIWKTYDNRFDYADEKINRIKDIGNVGDNFMFIVAMFDSDNQSRLADKLSQDTRDAVRERMIAGGNTENPIF